MPAFQDLTDKQFGRWTVLFRVENNRHNQPRWKCQCSCGTYKIVTAGILKSGQSKSCGCWNVDVHRNVCIERNTTHGLSKTPMHNLWCNMKARCEQLASSAYHKYGAKGISVCERWQDFENFLADMGERPSPVHTIDRIDSKGNYEPSNCRWATQKEQQNNRSNNRRITAFGKTLTLQQWQELTGIKREAIAGRLKRGWEPERALC